MMRTGRRPLFRAAVLGLLLLAQPVAARSDEKQRLSIPQARVLADKYYLSGNPAAARDVAKGLLQRDPNDVRALVVFSQSERALGNTRAATEAGKRAWSVASDQFQKYGAALVIAQAYSAAGARTRAQIWLRRAVQVAPDMALAERARRDYRYVRGRNPVSTRLKFSTQPSSNINNGSKSDTLVIDGLPFALSGDARALSGLETIFGFDTKYTKRLSPGRLLQFGFLFEGRSYALSSEARAQAPDQKAGDYAFANSEVSFSFVQAHQKSSGNTRLKLDVGRTWYGGARLSDYIRATVGYRKETPKGSFARYKFSLEQQWRPDGAIRDSTQILAEAFWGRRLSNGGVLRWNLGLRDTASQSATIAHEAALAAISYRPAKDIAGASLTWSLELESREYDKPLFGYWRVDHKARFGLSLFFPDLDYYGFAPQLDLTYSRNFSTISLYESDEIGLNFKLRSAL